MYIEFDIRDNDNMIDGYANRMINRALHEWSDRYQIPYNTKTVKYTKRITFDQDEHYSLFAMSWNPAEDLHALSKWRIVSDLNNKTSFDSVL
jgi:hypothetical protein